MGKEEDELSIQEIKDRVTRQDKADGISRAPGISPHEYKLLLDENLKRQPGRNHIELEREMTWAGYWNNGVEPSTTPANRPSTIPTTVMQGDTRGLTQHRGLHAPTIQEIIADANKPDPTAPYFDTNSDHMRQIDPLAPHYDLSGDFPRLVNPLKPGPKMPSNG